MRIFFFSLLIFLVSCGGQEISSPVYKVYFDANGSENADGSFAKPFTLQQAVNSGAEVLIPSASDGPIQANGVELMDEQSIIADADKQRPTILATSEQFCFLLTGSHTISGIEFKTGDPNTVTSDPFILAQDIHGTFGTKLNFDSLTFSGNRPGMEIKDSSQLTISDIQFSTQKQALFISRNFGQTNLQNITISGDFSKGIKLDQSRGKLALNKIKIESATKADLTIDAIDGNITIEGFESQSGHNALLLSGQEEASYYIKSTTIENSYIGLQMSGAADYWVEDITLTETQEAINIKQPSGYITVDKAHVETVFLSGLVGLSIEDGLAKANITAKNLTILGRMSVGVRIRENHSAITLDTLSLDNIKDNGMTLFNNQGPIAVKNSTFQFIGGVGISILDDRSEDMAYFENTSITGSSVSGIKLTNSQGSYHFNKLMISSSGEQDIQIGPMSQSAKLLIDTKLHTESQ